jgi:hypothetical protein
MGLAGGASFAAVGSAVKVRLAVVVIDKNSDAPASEANAGANDDVREPRPSSPARRKGELYCANPPYEMSPTSEVT